MTAGEYLEGACFLLLMLGGSGASAALWLRAMPELRGVPRVLGAAVLWLTGIFAVHLIPGVLGILSRWTVALAAVFLLAATMAVRRGREPVRAPAADLYPPAPPSGRASVLLAAAGLVLGGGVVLVAAIGDIRSAPSHPDVVSFHLPTVARWIQHGSLWPIDDFIPDRSPGNYPETGDVFSLAVILPWRFDFLVRVVDFPLLALVGCSIYAVARELRAPAATALLAATAFAASPAVSWVAYHGLADTSMLATFGAGSYFLLRSVRTGARPELLLAALALGLCLGTRWYAVPAVAAVVAVWGFAGLARGDGVRRTGGDVALLGGVAVFVGGFWLLRNWVQSGNPIFPVRVAPLGITIFDAPPDPLRALQGFTIAHYAFDWQIWRHYFWPGFVGYLGWVSLLLWGGLAGAGLAALSRVRPPGGRSASRADRARVLGVVAAAILIGLAYVVTPYTAAGPRNMPTFAPVDSRYVLPAMLLAAAAVAWIATQAGRWRRIVEVLLLAGTLDGLRRFLDLRSGVLGHVSQTRGLVGALVAVAVVAALARLVPGRGRAASLAAAGAILIALVAIGRIHERSYERHRYAAVNQVFTGFDTASDRVRRVGLVGEGWGNYPFFGPQLRNRVSYVGHRVRGTLRTYDARAPFARAVRRDRFDVIVFHDLDSIRPGRVRRAERWLYQAGWRPVATGTQPFGFNRRLTLYLPPLRSG